MGAKDFAEPYLKLKAISRKNMKYVEKLAGKNIMVLSSSGVAICGSCGKHIQINAKHKAECECPKCKKKMTVQHVWRMSKHILENSFIALPQTVSENCVVIRFVRASRNLNPADYYGDSLDSIKGTPWNTREVARIYYHENYADPAYYEVSWDSKKKKKIWTKTTAGSTYFRPDTYSICCRNANWVMYAQQDPENIALKEFSKLDCFKYYPLANLWDEDDGIFQIQYLMRTARINEKLEKMGLMNIVAAQYKEYESSDYYYFYKRRAWLTGNKPVLETLRLNKTQFEIFKEQPSKEMQRFLQKHPDVTYTEMKAFNFDLFKLRTVYAVAKAINVTRAKMFKYLQKNNINFAAYHNYINTLEKLKYNIKDNYYNMPKDFEIADKKITDEYLAQLELEQRRQEIKRRNLQGVVQLEEDKKSELISKISAGLRKMPDLQAFLKGSEGLLVHIPDSSEELIQEGKDMDNCIGTYIDRVAAKNTLVFYVRRIDKPNEPFVAFEYADGRVVQCMYKHNIVVDDPKIINFVDRFAEMLRRNNVLMAA